MVWQKGKSGNPSGLTAERAAIARRVQEIAGKNAEKAIQVLVEIMDDEDRDLAKSAAQAVLDRAVGKPLQSVEVGGKSDSPPIAIINDGVKKDG